MMKTKERKDYCTPWCSLLKVENEGFMRTSFNNPGGSGSGHAHAGDSGGLNAKVSTFTEEESLEDDKNGGEASWW